MYDLLAQLEKDREDNWVIVQYCLDPRCPCRHDAGTVIARAGTKREAEVRARPFELERGKEFRYTVEQVSTPFHP